MEDDEMKEEYDFSDGVRGKYAERIRKDGITITEIADDGSSSSSYFPPGTTPSGARRVHLYFSRNRWIIRTEGASRAFRRLSDEAEATRVATDLARKAGADLVVHFPRPKSRGKIRVA